MEACGDYGIKWTFIMLSVSRKWHLVEDEMTTEDELAIMCILGGSRDLVSRFITPMTHVVRTRSYTRQ